jgi:hypothetical protein
LVNNPMSRSGAPEAQGGAEPTPASDVYELAAIAQACLARSGAASDDALVIPRP